MFKVFKNKKKEKISDTTLDHATVGEFTEKSKRLLSGGHGQEALVFMDKNGVQYNIEKVYKNGVRVGNIPNHKRKQMQEGLEHSWFPKFWNRNKIKKVANKLARGHKLPDGKHKTETLYGVNVTMIRNDGKVATVFPNKVQKDKKGVELNEQRKNKKINKRDK